MKITIEERGNCIIVWGSLTPAWMTTISKSLPKKAIIEPDLARMFDANFAFGLREDVDALMREIAPEALRKAAHKHAGSNLSEQAVAWLASGTRGISSNTMFTVLTGVDASEGWHGDHPYDPSDVGRCRKLLEQCPELVPLLPKMAEVSPQWRALVAVWDDICSTMDEEVPNWRDGKGGRAPKTYQLIKTAIGRN